MRQNRAEETKEARRTRVPLGVPRAKMSTSQREGYVRRWVNDSVGRLQQAEQGGYQFVTDPSVTVGDAGKNDITQSSATDSLVSRVVGTREDGSPMRAYLMEIRKDWYDEDQAEKQKAIDETEASLRRGAAPVPGNASDGENRYIPHEGIKIEHSRNKD